MAHGQCDVCHGIQQIERSPASGSRCNRCDECVKALKESLQVGGGLRERDAFHVLAAHELTQWAETGTPGGRGSALGVGGLKGTSSHRLWLDKLMEVCFGVSGVKPQNANGQDCIQDKATGGVPHDWRRYFPGVQLKHDASLPHGVRVKWSPSSGGLPLPYAKDVGPLELIVVKKEGKPITALFDLGKRVKAEREEAGGSSRDHAASGGTGTGLPQQQGGSSSGSSAGGEKPSQSKRRASAVAKRPEEVNKELEERVREVEASMQELVMNSSLCGAARRGDVKAIVDMLSRGKGVDDRDTNYGHTPLMVAARDGHQDVVHVLLNRKADVNAVASISGFYHSDIRELDESNSGKTTPLFMAIGSIRSSVIHQLVEGGADVNQNVGNVGTALHMAAMFGWVSLADYLLRAGADCAIRNSGGMTAAESAAQMQMLNLIDFKDNRGGHQYNFLGVYKQLTGKEMFDAKIRVEEIIEGFRTHRERKSDTWSADSAVLKELRQLIHDRGQLKGKDDLALRRLLEDDARAKVNISEREGMEDNLTFRSKVVEEEIRLFEPWGKWDGVGSTEILGKASLPVGLKAELIHHGLEGILPVDIATLFSSVGKLYAQSSAGSLALSTTRFHTAIAVRRDTDVVGGVVLKRACLEPHLKPVLYVHLLAVDSDKVGPGRLGVGAGAEPVADWLVSEARRQLEWMLEPGQTSYILTQSVGYKHDKTTFECVPDEDERYRKGRLFWEKHTQPLDASARWMALQLQFETGVDNSCCFRFTTVTRAMHPANRVVDVPMEVDPPSTSDVSALDAVRQRVAAAEEELRVCKEWFKQADSFHSRAIKELSNLKSGTTERKVKERRLPFRRQELDAAIKARKEAEREIEEGKAEEARLLMPCIA